MLPVPVRFLYATVENLMKFVYIKLMAVDADKPNIYNYFNYREYLSALFNYNKAINPIRVVVLPVPRGPANKYA